VLSAARGFVTCRAAAATRTGFVSPTKRASDAAESDACLIVQGRVDSGRSWTVGPRSATSPLCQSAVAAAHPNLDFWARESQGVDQAPTVFAEVWQPNHVRPRDGKPPAAFMRR
jgi:hypothetical protein